MTAQFFALTFDAHDPQRLAQFWAGVLNRKVDDDGLTLLPDDDKELRLRFLPSQEERIGSNRVHFDLTSAFPEEQQQTVDRALSLGAQHIDVGQLPEEGHTVLADPEGNEFCVIPAGNNFLADTAFIGALSCDGSQQVGYFWSEALAWPLVWDQDEETAIQSPRGGTKFAWGGPPVAPKTGKNRLCFELTVAPGQDHEAEVERLVALGARRLGTAEGEVVLADPDDNEFSVWIG